MMIANGAQGMIVKRRLPYVIKKERNGAGRDHAGAVPGREALTLQTDDGPPHHYAGTAALGLCRPAREADRECR
jgi:hypothetical protein